MRKVAAQSHLRYPLNSLLGSPGSLRVLRALVLASGPQGVTQLAGATGLTPQGVRNVVASLVAEGIAIGSGSGRAPVYAANPAHPLHGLLRQLFAAERSRWMQLREGMRRILAQRPAVRAAWQYGSTARSEDVPGSDLDLAILVKGASVDRVLAAVRKDLRSVEDDFGITCSVIGLSAADVARQVRGAAPGDWWSSMVGDAQVLKGPHPEQLAAEIAEEANA